MIKIRLKFYKTGAMRFIGHLDMMRYFQKAIRRAEIDVSYSGGFSPHQILSFASPLGVGHTSDGEYLDLQLESFLSLANIKERLNAVMEEDVQVVCVTKLKEQAKTSMALLAAADYLVSVRDGYPFLANAPEVWSSFLEQESIIVRKKTKKKEIAMDIRPSIYAAAWKKEEFAGAVGQAGSDQHALPYENGQKIYLQVSCGSVLNLKPELVMEAFASFAGFPYDPFAFQVHRMEMYTDLNAKKGEINTNLGPKKRNLIPLDSCDLDQGALGSSRNGNAGDPDERTAS